MSPHNLLQELCYSLTPQQYSTENFGACFYSTILNGREHYGNIAKGLTNAQTNTQTKGYLLHPNKSHNKIYCHGRTVILQESNRITHKNKKNDSWSISHHSIYNTEFHNKMIKE